MHLVLLAFLAGTGLQADRAMQTVVQNVVDQVNTKMCTPSDTSSPAEVRTVVKIVQGDKTIDIQIHPKDKITVKIENDIISIESGQSTQELDKQIKELTAKLDKFLENGSADALVINCGEDEASRLEAGAAACDENCSGTEAATEQVTQTAGEVSNIVEAAKCAEKDSRSYEWRTHPLYSDLNCAMNVFAAASHSLKLIPKFIYSATALGVDLGASSVDKAIGTNFAKSIEGAKSASEAYIGNLWSRMIGAEDASTEILSSVAAASFSPEELRALSSGEEMDPEFYERVFNYFSKLITDSFGCQKWAAVPYLSKCLEPWNGYHCADFNTKMMLVCGVMGYVASEIPQAFLFGLGLRKSANAGLEFLGLSRATIDRIQDFIAPFSRGKIPPSSSKSLFDTATAKVMEKIASKLAQHGTKLNFIGNAKKIVVQQIKLIAQRGKIVLPGEHLKALADAVANVSGQAMKWYFRELEAAMARGVGGESLYHSTRVRHLANDHDEVMASVRQIEQQIADEVDETAKTILAYRKDQQLARAKRLEASANVSRERYEMSYFRDHYQRRVKFHRDKGLAEAEKVRKLAISKATNPEARETAQKAYDETAAKVFSIAEQSARSDITNTVDMAEVIFTWAERNIELINNQFDEALVKCRNFLHNNWRKNALSTPENLNTWLTEETARRTAMGTKEGIEFDTISGQVKEVLRSASPAQAIAKNDKLKYVPRIRAVNHRNATAIGDNEEVVDIRNTDIDDLPEFWKRDNVQAAKNLITKYFDLRKKANLTPNETLASRSQFTDVSRSSSRNGQTIPDLWLKLVEKLKRGDTEAIRVYENDPILRMAGLEALNFDKRTGIEVTTFVLGENAGESASDFFQNNKVLPLEEKNKAVPPATKAQ